MTDRHRRLRVPDRLGCSALAAVGEIDDDPERVEPFNCFVAEPAEPCIAGLQAAVSNELAPVVGQLHDPNAEAGKEPQAIEVAAEHPCALKAVDQAQPAYLLRCPEVLQGPYVFEHVRMSVGFTFPIRDVAERLFNGVSIDCKVDGSNAGPGCVFQQLSV